jgi:hypothetical protein
MAINATVYDLEGYSENSKTVTLDLLKIVPVGAQGDEKFVLTCKTSAYSNFISKTTIDDIFVQEFLCGWCKSSGFKGAVFTIETGVNDTLKVKIDGVTAFQTITLNTGTNLTGDAVATDIQIQLRELGEVHTPAGPVDGNLGYVNCRCSFVNSRFVIKSGTISKLLSGTGTDVSSVKMDTSGTASISLGFDLFVDSNNLAGTDIREAMSGAYTAGSPELSIPLGIIYDHGDSMCIQHGSTVDYFTAVSGTITSIQVTTSGVHGFDGISNSYPLGGKVQRLQYNDPEYTPGSCLNSVDDALTWGILSLANQIDFSG